MLVLVFVLVDNVMRYCLFYDGFVVVIVFGVSVVVSDVVVKVSIVFLWCLDICFFCIVGLEGCCVL